MKIGVVVLNYNGWQDTLACAESILASKLQPASLLLVDNCSANDSLDKIRSWAAGHLNFKLEETGGSVACCKPLHLLELTENDPPSSIPAKIALLRLSHNGGYASGNNAGIRLLMHWGMDAVWILNNDTIVDKDAMEAMVQRLFSKSRPGLCGSLILYADTENLVQCRAGGFTNTWTGLSALNGTGENLQTARLVKPEMVEKSINFIYGASVMASREFIETVGLMDERFFLYCEEQDWAYSAAGRFELAYAPDAIVWHKEGCSTGFSRTAFNPRRLWNLLRSRLLLTYKHNPLALPIVCSSILYAALRMLWRRVARKLLFHSSTVK